MIGEIIELETELCIKHPNRLLMVIGQENAHLRVSWKKIPHQENLMKVKIGYYTIPVPCLVCVINKQYDHSYAFLTLPNGSVIHIVAAEDINSYAYAQMDSIICYTGRKEGFVYLRNKYSNDPEEWQQERISSLYETYIV